MWFSKCVKLPRARPDIDFFFNMLRLKPANHILQLLLKSGFENEPKIGCHKRQQKKSLLLDPLRILYV